MTLAVASGFAQEADIESSGRALDREVLVQYVTALVLVVSAFVASRAVLHADRAISGRHRNGTAPAT